MKIGFDARLINETGVGRYIYNILPLMVGKNKKNHWVIIVRQGEKALLKKSLKGLKNYEIVIFNYRWHSFLEQILLPLLLYKKRLSIFHTPYINVPVFYFKKKAVTIHDLTVLSNKTGEASTKNYFYYTIKRIGYLLALKSALRSNVIFTVTNSVKNEIIDKFKINEQKIIVTPNGLVKIYPKMTKSSNDFIKRVSPYFFYVGNAHPHKNLMFLVNNLHRVFTRLPKFKMVLAGKHDYFFNNLQQYVSTLSTKNNFIFIDNPSDNQVALIYKYSTCTILPSKKEGFGLQILEAMHCEVPIVASKIDAYEEVGGGLTFSFDPTSNRSFVMALNKSLRLSKKEKDSLFKKYRVHLKRFSWDDSAKDTLQSLMGDINKINSHTKKLIPRHFGS